MPISIKVLKAKAPFQQFPEKFLEQLVAISQITYHSKGDVIFREGDENDECAFLVLGKVSLQSSDGKTSFVNFNQSEARFSLGNLKPRQHTATAESYNTCMLWIPRKKVDQLTDECLVSDNTGIFSELIPDRRNSSRARLA